MLLHFLVYFPCCLARLLTMEQCVQDDQRVDRWIDRDSYGYTMMMNKMTVLFRFLNATSYYSTYYGGGGAIQQQQQSPCK